MGAGKLRRARSSVARLGAACALVMLGAWPVLAAATPNPDGSERGKQKNAAETERAQLREKLSALKREIGRTESAQDSAMSKLANSEEAISNANRSLRELAQEQKQTEAKLQHLAAEQDKLAKSAAEQQQKLAALLRDQYVAGNEDRIKLLLSGDNPNRINRELQYMGYISQAQAKLIDTLRSNLAAIESNKLEIKATRDALNGIERDEREHRAALEKEKSRHAQLLAELSSKLTAQKQEAGRLERDEKRLSSLVDQLAKLIDEQKKAEAEERRRQQMARAKAAQEKRQARRSGEIVNGKPGNPDAIDDVEPPARAEPHESGHRVQDGAFAALRGKLKAPVQGALVAKFGSKRAEGPNWKGWLFRAPEGAEIHAVAPGKVIFAEWLRGFGNLIIIDHGSEYLTIYGNNQALFKHAGDVVKAGDAIASAGNSGGNEQSGLYFEMRHQGRAIDPLGWVTIR